MTLLEQMDRQRLEDREHSRQKVRRDLRDALDQIIPGQRVVVFGSLVRSGKFNDYSDIDLALESELPQMTVYQLISLLSERMGRTVDVILLDECPFREKIRREGELWMLRA